MRKRHIPPAILIAILIVLFTIFAPKILLINDIDLLVKVIGLAFGLLSAFKISQLSERISSLKTAVANEVGSLYDLVFIVSTLKNKKLLEELKHSVKDYSQSLTKIEWLQYPKESGITKKFEKIYEIIHKINPKNSKEVSLFKKIIDVLIVFSTARTHQLVTIRVKTSKLQWGLLLFLAVSLISTLSMLSTQTGATSIISLIIMNLAVFFIMLVIFDFDQLSFSASEIGDEPMYQLVNDIDKIR